MFVRNYRLKTLVQRAMMLLRLPLDYGEMHPYRGMQRRAHEDTLDFISAKMPRAISFQVPRDLLEYALGLITLEGLVMEFGVFEGKTIDLIAKQLRGRRVDGFDSFEGLPEPWHGNHMAEGYFKSHVPKVRKNVRLHAGWFSDTLPEFVERNRESVAFMHIDCDLYSSTATLFEHLGDRIVPGTVIVFDEYFNYPGWREHEYRAFTEFVSRSGCTFDYVGYAFAQVAVVIR